MKICKILFVAIIFLTGCSSSFDITKTVSSENANIITYTSPKFQVKSEYESQTFFTELQFFCYQEGKDKKFSIAASYVSNQWPYFEKIIFDVDGSEYEFEPDRPPVRDLYNLQGPTETITVQIPENIIIDIYESMDTRMTVKGYEKFAYTVYWKDSMKMKLFKFHKATM